MSLVSSLVNANTQIQAVGTGIQTGLDVNDKTFADILEKQMGIQPEEQQNIIQQLGAPAGFEIQDFLFDGSQRDIMNVAKKQATDMYNRYSKSVVTDLKEFVSDSYKLLK